MGFIGNIIVIDIDKILKTSILCLVSSSKRKKQMISTEFALARFTNLSMEEVHHFTGFIRVVHKTAIGYHGCVRPECQYDVYIGIVQVEPGVGVLIWMNSHASGPRVWLDDKVKFDTIGNFHWGDQEAVEKSIETTCKEWGIKVLVKFGGHCMIGSYEGLKVMGYYGKDNSFVEACSLGYRYFEKIENPGSHTMASNYRVRIPGPDVS